MAFLNAQEPVRIIIDEKVGLPSNEIYAIEEDSKGFIWLATNKGLQRYDGTTFKSYKHPEQRGLSMFEPFIDDEDRVWCMNISGQIFYAQKDELILFADLKDDLNGSLASIVANDDYLIVSMYLRNIIIDLKSKEKQIELFRSDNYDISTDYGLNKKHNDGLYQTLDHHVRQFKDGSFYKVFKLPENISSVELRPSPIQLLQDEESHLFILQQVKNTKPKVFKRVDNQWIELEVPAVFKNANITMPRFIDNRLWCPTNKGILVFAIIENKLVLNAKYLENFYTTDLFKDTDHNIWVSTLRKGLIVLPNIYVEKININNELPKRLEKIGENQLLIGLESGNAILFDVTTNTQTIVEFATSSAITAMTHNEITNQTFVFQKIHNYTLYHNDLSISKNENKLTSVKDAAVVNKDTIIAASSGSLIVTTVKNNQSSSLKKHLFDKKQRGYSVLYDLTTRTKYFAAVDGLYYTKNNTDLKLVTYQESPLLVKKLAQDINGNIWAATFKNGIFKIENNKVTQHLNTQNGLTSNVINALTVDDNHLWIATENGLQRYDINDHNFKSLKAQDGIPSFSIIDIIVVGDHIYINTSQEVFKIDKKMVFKPAVIPEYYFTKVIVDGKKQPEQDIYVIPNPETSTTIGFNANGLRGLSSSTYKYRIKDHTDWTQLQQGNNSVQFASLPVGDVTFQLKQSESDIIKELSFEVKQVFYKTLWFWTIVVSTLIAGIILYYRSLLRFRESEKNKQLRKLVLDNELVSLRLENLRSQMNPHFIFNALNSIQEYIVSNEKNLASSYLVKFSRLIRMYLEQSRENQISLKEEIHAMQLYLELEKVRFEDKLNYEINVDSSLHLENVKVPPLFIQPYVENAIKHGLLHKKTDRRLEVNFDRDVLNNTLTICVKDNGIGREQAAVIKAERVNYHKSFATYANNERVELLNRKRKEKISVEIQDLQADKGTACGTCVCISIPQH